MNKIVSRILVACAFLCASGFAVADSYAEVWTCTTEEDKSIEDVQAANSKWLKWINENVEGGGITSAVGTAVVGDAEIFLFIDTYPDLATWSTAKAALDTEEGEALEEVFEGISDCTENRLWKVEATE